MTRAARIALSLLAVVACSAARGQSGRGRAEEPVKPIALTSTSAEIGMEFQYFGETIRRREAGRIRYSNSYLQEYVAGRARGYVYHPRLLEFSTELKLGLAQQRLRRTEGRIVDSSASNDELLGYDLRIDLLRKHPVSATAEASKDERILMGLFVDRYLVKTELQRGTVRWRTPSLQMDATGTHAVTEEYGAVSRSRTVSDSLAYNLHHQIGRRIRTDLRYMLQNYDRRFRAETVTGDIDNESSIDSQTVTVDNRIDLTADRKATLKSSLRVHDQQNSQDLRTWSWQEKLQLEHAPNLRSYAMGSVLRNEYDSRNIDTVRGEAGIDHELFKSLKSHLDLHGRRTDYGDVVEDRYGATGRLNYRKTTPLGVFSAGYSRTLDQVERSGVSASDAVLDESIVVNLATPAFLDHPDVVASSIVVTDEANLITYVEGFDYEVVQQGRRTGIRVLPGGLLADGDTVLVDYRIELDGSLDYVADDQDIHVRHDFDRYVRGLSLYAQRHEMDARSVESEIDPHILEYVDQSVGLRQSWKSYELTSEYQEYRDDLGGFDQWRNQLEGNHALSRRVRGGWSAGYTQTDHRSDDIDDVEDRSRYWFAGAHVDGTFARNGFWKVEGRSMRETGRSEQTVHGILGRVGFDWRRLTIESGARYEEYDVFESERDRVQLFVKVKWRFEQSAPGRRRT